MHVLCPKVVVTLLKKIILTSYLPGSWRELRQAEAWEEFASKERFGKLVDVSMKFVNLEQRSKQTARQATSCGKSRSRANG
jgi:hypothetical protein